MPVPVPLVAWRRLPALAARRRPKRVRGGAEAEEEAEAVFGTVFG